MSTNSVSNPMFVELPKGLLDNLLKDIHCVDAVEEINEEICKISLIDLPGAPPYPTIPSEIKPYYNHLIKTYVTEPKLKVLNDRTKAVSTLIMVGVLGKIVFEPDPENIPGGILKSMIDAVGKPKSIEFISSIGLEAIQELVEYLDTQHQGAINLLIMSKV